MAAAGSHARSVLAVCLLAAAAVACVPSARAAGSASEQRAAEAATAMQRNQEQRAVQLFTEALSDSALSNNRRASLLNDRGVAYSRLDQARTAIEDFNRAVQLAPEMAHAYNNRGNILLKMGFAQEATKDFDRALVLAPGYASAYANRASAHVRLGDTEAAMRDFSHAIRLSPKAAAPLLGRGLLKASLNRPHAALRDFSRAVASDMAFSAGYRARADAKIALMRFEEATDDLTRAVAFEQNDAEIYLKRGYTYLAQRNVAAAKKDFARAAEINPRWVVALEALALANAKSEAYDDALNDLARAIEIDQRSGLAYAVRAIVYKWMNQAENAAKDLERAKSFDPDLPEVIWARAELGDIAADDAKGAASLAKAVRQRPWLRDAAIALDRLSGGRHEAVDVPVLAFESWRVSLENGRYTATSRDIPKIAVPLEILGEAPPRIIGWDVKTEPLAGIGVLRFIAGQVPGPQGPVDVENAAVIDIAGRSLVTVETVRQGDQKATWDWSSERLAVTDLDGYAEEYPLTGRRNAVAQQGGARRAAVRDGGSQGMTPDWAPWAQPSDRRPETGGNRRAGSNVRPAKPKTLFDLLFN
ncbi:MAG: hypothetical protein R3D68_08685 [Hyphomicrobiaceae bacterium]